jgi:hypothetical protein
MIKETVLGRHDVPNEKYSPLLLFPSKLIINYDHYLFIAYIKHEDYSEVSFDIFNTSDA